MVVWPGPLYMSQLPANEIVKLTVNNDRDTLALRAKQTDSKKTNQIFFYIFSIFPNFFWLDLIKPPFLFFAVAIFVHKS